MEDDDRHDEDAQEHEDAEAKGADSLGKKKKKVIVKV